MRIRPELVCAVLGAWTTLMVTAMCHRVLAVPSDPVPKYATTWFLVSLREPIPEPGPPAALPLATGMPLLDDALVLARVSRIEYALPVAVAAAAPAPVSGGRGREGMRSDLAEDSARIAADRMAAFGFDRTYKLFVPEGSDIPGLAARFAALPEVAWAEPDYIGYGGSSFPNDALFGNQYGLHNTGQTGGSVDADIDAPEGWDASVGSSRVIIAILDTGVDTDHEDFAGKLLPGWDFVNNDAFPEDDQGHGSNTSSIAAAVTNNGVGIAGTCWNCRILPLKNLDSNNQGFYSWWSDSLIYAADHGARVINMSEGGTGGSSLLHDAIRYAYQAGCVITAAMMNDNAQVAYVPAAFIETIAVGATDKFDQRASPFCWGGGSNFGSHIDVSAPGDLILGVAMGGGYNYWCGTSQATPFVTGLAGLIEGIYPSAGRDEVKHLLQAGADDGVGRMTEDTPGFDIYHGWGRINAQRTLAGTRGSISLRVTGPSATRLFHATPNPLATSFDFIRGTLGSLTEDSTGVRLGTVVCLENDSADADTVGHEDTVLPSPGQAFFYLSRFKAADGKGSYGGSSRNRDRIPTAGDCAP